ncbi:MAG TPA: hypothetical protein V6C82_06975, partial [Chroococcales cyanobacterium]
GEPFDAKVLVDSLGLQDGKTDSDILDLLKGYGVEVLTFNKNYLSLQALGVPITHRKLLVADGERFITGGRNIGDEYLKDTFVSNGKEVPSWHDLSYLVVGDETGRIEREFSRTGGAPGGKFRPPCPLPSPPKPRARSRACRPIPRMGNTRSKKPT